MIDIHSHILPGIDDGSKNEEESLKMLRMLKEQGVRRVVATPHFNANNESVEAFLKRRNKACDDLKVIQEEGLPEIILGAEVRYYEGISRLENLRELCAQGTDILLLEMFSGRWGSMVKRELIEISSRYCITLVLAHIERYMHYQSMDDLEYLLDNGVMMQMNSSHVNGFFTRHKALNLLKNEKVHFLGSDCHDLIDRPPDIGKASEIIKNKLGTEFLKCFIDYGNSLFL